MPPSAAANSRRESWGAFMVRSSRSPGPPATNRADDAIVGAATAEIRCQGCAHVGFGGVRNAIEQFLGGHDHAVDAVSALPPPARR